MSMETETDPHLGEELSRQREPWVAPGAPQISLPLPLPSTAEGRLPQTSSLSPQPQPRQHPAARINLPG